MSGATQICSSNVSSISTVSLFPVLSQLSPPPLLSPTLALSLLLSPSLLPAIPLFLSLFFALSLFSIPLSSFPKSPSFFFLLSRLHFSLSRFCQKHPSRPLFRSLSFALCLSMFPSWDSVYMCNSIYIYTIMESLHTRCCATYIFVWFVCRQNGSIRVQYVPSLPHGLTLGI